MASRSKRSDESYYKYDRKRPEGENERKADKVAGKGSPSYCLKLRRKWVDGGMKGPNPYNDCMKGNK